ncbi:hypothetical protein CRD60_02365 [Bifidobacterium aemilianum]|uniref:Uncharacterized protein n=1 Tax=Bifidobacterium aemilianum TaxID=2493120 RepID=A0A366K8H4_9BIFI|nr:hypothetical protein CRD60_02365 [Bifidobacterium aemilianum]
MLAIFMVVMLLAGIIYAGIHGTKALHKLAGLMQVISSHRQLDSMEANGEEQEPVVFTEPLSYASGRYSKAHVGIEERKASRRTRHAQIWGRWRSFNE